MKSFMSSPFSLSVLIAFILSSCAVEPSPIEYGKDACHFCKMNIVDNQHAAELVTKKGKAFKYDAIECMMQSRSSWTEEETGLYLTTIYDNPGKLIDATQAIYLISEAIPSPMGANLSGFESKTAAENIQQEKGGLILSWEELKVKYEQ